MPFGVPNGNNEMHIFLKLSLQSPFLGYINYLPILFFRFWQLLQNTNVTNNFSWQLTYVLNFSGLDDGKKMHK